jgi:hypothetical protein
VVRLTQILTCSGLPMGSDHTDPVVSMVHLGFCLVKRGGDVRETTSDEVSGVG